MPRRPTDRDEGVPLWLIPQKILEWITRVGEELEWIHIRRSCHNLFAIRIRLRSVKRVFSRRAALAARAGGGAA